MPKNNNARNVQLGRFQLQSTQLKYQRGEDEKAGDCSERVDESFIIGTELYVMYFYMCYNYVMYLIHVSIKFIQSLKKKVGYDLRKSRGAKKSND